MPSVAMTTTKTIAWWKGSAARYACLGSVLRGFPEWILNGLDTLHEEYFHRHTVSLVLGLEFIAMNLKVEMGEEARRQSTVTYP